MSTARVRAKSPASELHGRCGVYTRINTVRAVLDAVGWTPSVDLARARLLEPAAGDGSFVVEAATRLLSSFRSHNHDVTEGALSERIRSFELIGTEAKKARRRITALLEGERLEPLAAKHVAAEWVKTGDFLLQPPSASFTHIVGNPPYCRWSRVPEALRRRYEGVLASEVARGDIFLPFLAQGIACLTERGRLGFVCSDRWKFMGFADKFRRTRLTEVKIIKDTPVNAEAAFSRSVDAYSTLLVLERSASAARPPSRRRRKTLAEAGYQVRVGPALGCTAAYVLEPDEEDVEDLILGKWFDGRDIGEGRVVLSGRRVIVLHDSEGRLRSLSSFPRTSRRLNRFRDLLSQRFIVRVDQRPWYAPIDRVRLEDWARPKIVLPEIARTPRVALDISGAIPSHGVYAIFAPDDQLEKLHEKLADGGLARALHGRAPKVKGGYVRCYKRFLDAIQAP